ncbi:MAG: A/G-specific adenine glycosylase, partial [Methyloligellaceae bacterium]
MALAADTGISISSLLLEWYDESRRDLAWRYPPGQKADPYRVWLSEIMLQQPPVKAVEPYFNKFARLWPNVEALAAAELEDVLKAWAGLGYYSRARNLHRCAELVVESHGGKFPDREEALLKLPGIGPYTAAAIAAIAFDRPATVVDGNVERVIARLYAVETPLPDAKPRLKELAAGLTPRERPGDYAQALMDLGATICSPKKPSCMLCPLKGHCDAHGRGLAARLPLRQPRAERPVRRGAAFVALREDGCVLLRQRPQQGLLGGMMELPSSPWTDVMPDEDDFPGLVPVRADWCRVPGLVTHTFTHFRLELEIYRAVIPSETPLNLWAEPERCRWVHRSGLNDEALPSVMRK